MITDLKMVISNQGVCVRDGIGLPTVIQQTHVKFGSSCVGGGEEGGGAKMR